jgi:hypothetical protein
MVKLSKSYLLSYGACFHVVLNLLYLVRSNVWVEVFLCGDIREICLSGRQGQGI